MDWIERGRLKRAGAPGSVRIHLVTLGILVAAVLGDRAWTPAATRTLTVVDPAGVTVVVNRAPAWDAGEGWAVDPEPLTQIGALEGSDPFLFTQLAGATRLDDGRFVVLEGVTRQFRVFDAAGGHRASFGRAGEGPGEFAAEPDWVVLGGDTLLAYDPARARYSWFTLDGRLVRQSITDPAIAAEEMRSMPARDRFMFADGSMLRADRVPGARESLRALEGGSALSGIAGERDRWEILLSVADPRAATAVDLGRFPSEEAISLRTSGATSGAWVTNPYFPAVHYGIDPIGGEVHVATPGVREIRTYDHLGDLERIIRQDVPLYPITDEMVERSLSALLDQPGAEEMGTGELTTVFGLLSVPDSIFPYSGLEVDTGGNLWLLDRYRVTRDGPRPYQLFDPQGRWLGPVAIPAGAGRVLELGDGYVLTEWLDDLDVPYLRMYRIEKGER